jgi:hypothetical protein
MQTITRLPAATTSNYGHVYPAGTAVSNRGDFATLDNPFHSVLFTTHRPVFLGLLPICLPSENPKTEHTDHGTCQDQPHRIQFETKQNHKGE